MPPAQATYGDASVTYSYQLTEYDGLGIFHPASPQIILKLPKRSFTLQGPTISATLLLPHRSFALTLPSRSETMRLPVRSFTVKLGD